MDNIEDINWDLLPDTVLSHVFQHLGRNDRYSASLVCKSWSRGFRFPELWRKVSFSSWTWSFFTWSDRKSMNFWSDSELPAAPIFVREAFKFINSLGDYVKELDIIESRWLPKTMSKESMRNFLEFLLILNEKPVSLKKFRIHNVSLNWKNDLMRRKMVKLFLNFLDMQRDMTHFNISGCKASMAVCILILSQLTRNKSLRNLNLVNFFNKNCTNTVLSSVLYQDCMRMFENLFELSISYNCIDSNILRILLKNCHPSLKVLKISLGASKDRKDHVIPNDTWAWVKKKCPGLQVHVHIEGCIESLEMMSDYIRIIPSEMGLHTFDLDIGNDYDISLDPFLTHLCNFQETLVDIRINLLYSQDVNYRSIIQLFSTCSKLKYFTFLEISSKETVKTLYENLMQMNDGALNLKSCSFGYIVRAVDERTKAHNENFDDEMQKLCQTLSQKQGGEYKLVYEYQ